MYGCECCVSSGYPRGSDSDEKDDGLLRLLCLRDRHPWPGTGSSTGLATLVARRAATAAEPGDQAGGCNDVGNCGCSLHPGLEGSRFHLSTRRT